MNYSETVHFLFTSLPVFQHSGGSAYKPGLQTACELDDFYGNPHRKYKTIHVAGTNGKGSVSHMLAAVLQGCGYKTGLFTSPHLEDFRERIKVNGEMISEQEVVEFVERSRNLFDKVQPSFFEMTSAMAFDHFARRQVDIAVIETGMGGRLDATNIILPVMSVITNIGYDHTMFLGNNLIAISGEKAGIIKPNVPVVIGESQSGTNQVFEKKARQLGCPIVFADQHARVSRTEYLPSGQALYIKQNEQEHPQPVIIDLIGDYQQTNIVTVLMTIQCLRLHTNIEIASENILPSLKHAARTTGLRGRWQVLRQEPLVVCDVGHNVDGFSWIIRQLGCCVYEKLHIVVGFVNDKDVSGMLGFLPPNAVYYFTKASIPRALDENELARQAGECGLSGTPYPLTDMAIEAALRNADATDMIFIGGSTFVVAEALSIADLIRNRKLSGLSS